MIRLNNLPYRVGRQMQFHGRRYGARARAYWNASQQWRAQWRPKLWEAAPKLGIKTLTTDTKQGRFTVNTSDQFISKALFLGGSFEYEVINRAVELLVKHEVLKSRNQGLLLDIGANIGTVCVSLLRRDVFSGAVAFEPHPGNYELLQKNVKQNGLAERVQSFPMGLSAQSGELVFELSPDNSGDHRIRLGDEVQSVLFDEAERQITRVPVTTLDEMAGDGRINADDIRLIWMDVQGHEGHVLAGAQSVLGRGVPTVMEFWPYGLERAGITQEMFVERLKANFTHMIDVADESGELLDISCVNQLYKKYSADVNTDLILLRR